MKNLSVDQVIKLYEEEGLSAQEIAEGYYYSIDAIDKVLNDYYCKIGIQRPYNIKCNILSEQDNNEIIKQYFSGVSLDKILLKYNCSDLIVEKIINNYCNINNIKRPLKTASGKLLLPKKNIIRKYENGISVKDISDFYNCSKTTINKLLNRYYFESGLTRPYMKLESKEFKLPEDEIVKKYEDKINVSNIAREYNSTSYIINKLLNNYYKRNNLKKPINKNSTKFPRQEIIDKYKNNVSIKKLASTYNCSEGIINNILSKDCLDKGLLKSRQNSNHTKIIFELLTQNYTIDEIKDFAKEAKKELKDCDIKKAISIYNKYLQEGKQIIIGNIKIK